MNATFARQLNRFRAQTGPPEDWQGFVAVIADTYDHQERQVSLYVRSMELAGEELRERNEQLHDKIRALQQLESELRTAQKLEAVGQLAAGIAHEINTPVQYLGDSVSFLRGAVEDLLGVAEQWRRALPRLREGLDDTLLDELTEAMDAADLEYLVEQAPAALDRARDGTDRVATIVKAMKEFAHPDQREMTRTDLNRGVENTLVVGRSEYKYCAEVTFSAGELPAVVCHGGAINQVVLNLVVNAAHAIQDAGRGSAGRIEVRTRVVDTHVELSVTDNGSGIPAAVRHRVFDPFFTTKEVGRGTGQGLSIARQIVVDTHGGELTFTTTEGEGTTFLVRLPIDGRVPQ